MGEGYPNNHLVKDGLVSRDHVLEFDVQNCLQYHLVSNLGKGEHIINIKQLWFCGKIMF